MITVELSNIWGAVSLPELLASEKELFRAHLSLRNNQPDGPDFLGWLGMSESAMARMVHTMNTAAERIRSMCDTLVVVSPSANRLASKAMLRLLGGQDLSVPQILFSGNTLSGDAWLALSEKLDGHDFCLHLVDNAAMPLETCVASRAVRWLLERRYGKDAKNRIFVTAPEGSPMAVMAAEEGYTLLSLPEQLGACGSSLTSGSLLPAAVGGIDALEILSGAAEAWKEYDLRAFENPVWMYAGARQALQASGRCCEVLSSFDPLYADLGLWWQQHFLQKAGSGMLPHFALYPADLDAVEPFLTGSGMQAIETVLLTPPSSQHKVHIEMDWKDYDGLGDLSGLTVDALCRTMRDACRQAHSAADVPMMELETDGFDAPHVGELLYFFELSAALCAAMNGSSHSSAVSLSARSLTSQLLRHTESSD